MECQSFEKLNEKGNLLRSGENRKGKMSVDKMKMLTRVDIANKIEDNRSKWRVSNETKCSKYCDANDYFSLNHPDTKQHRSMVFYCRLSNGHSRSVPSKTL